VQAAYAPIPIAVHIPGRILERRPDGSVRREPAEPAGLMLTEDQAARVLQFDLTNHGDKAVYYALYRLRKKGWLRAARRGRGQGLHYPTEEVVRCSRLMVEGLDAKQRKARDR